MADTLAPASNDVLWPDLSAHGVTLGMAKHNQGDALVFVDTAGKYSHIARRMGFQKTKWAGLWTRSDTRIEPSSFKTAFPRVEIRHQTREALMAEGMRRVQEVVDSARQPLLPGFDPIGAVQEDLEPLVRPGPAAPRETVQVQDNLTMARVNAEGEPIDLTPLNAEAFLVGPNGEGHEVWETPEGKRFTRFDLDTEEGVKREVEHEQAFLNATNAEAAKFLRAPTQEALDLCADAFVRAMAEDQHVARVDELDRFYRAVTGRPFHNDEPDKTRVLDAIDRARVRKLASLSEVPDDTAFHAALRLHEAAQYYSVVQDHRMTPLPVGVALQHIAGALPENASVRVTNSLFGEFNALTATSSRFRPTEGEADLLLAAYEGNLLDQAVEAFGTSVSRNDHAQVLQSLGNIAAQGVGIFVIEGDVVPGRIGPSSRRFMDALATLHEVEGVIDLDGAMMGVPGAPPSRIIVVGHRRETPGHGGLPPSVPHVTDYPSLWSWANQITEAIRKPGSVPYAARGGVSSQTAVEENIFQSPYIPTSVLSEPSLMIPRNLASPTRKALIEISRDIPHMDPWLEKRLGYEPGTLNKALSSEQADAVAMALHRQDRGLGFMLSDQTGIGKGRVLAAMARAAYEKGEPVVMLTERADLFTDFWRDLEDIGADHLFTNVMILNEDCEITSTRTGEVVAKSADREEVDRVIRSMAMPEGVQIVFGTYSQFNRDPIKAMRTHLGAQFDDLTSSQLSANAKKAMDYAQSRRKAQGLKELKSVLVEAVDIADNKDLVDRMPLPAAKSFWIGKAVSDSMLIMDECHNASGEVSQTNMNVDRAVRNAKHVVYSSATFARTGMNMRIFRRLFPQSVDVEALHVTLKNGGEVVQEALSSMLAQDGAMIRREHDLSMVKFLPKVDNAKRVKRNTEHADLLAEILASMVALTRESRIMVESMSEETKDVLLNAKLLEAANQGKTNVKPSDFSKDLEQVGVIKRSPIGNSFYTIMRSFLVLLKTDLAAEEAVEAIREGCKPVIVLDHTMESELMRRVGELKDQGLTRDTPFGTFVEAPDFRFVLKDALEAMCKVSLDGNDLEVKKRPEFSAIIRHIESLIDKFPVYPTSPIDVVRQKIEMEGFTVAELSGRKHRIEYDGNGNGMVQPIQKSERKRAKDRFNNGDAQALILTRAGNSGSSLHDSPRFLNRGRRVMIEMEVPEDVIARMQFFGRVNRKDQVSYPEIRTLSSGIPAENRQLALQNNKIRAMSANITANRDNAAVTKEVTDVINIVGNMVCHRLLESRPDIAEALDIEVEKGRYNEDGEFENVTFFGNKYVNAWMSKLSLFRVHEQEEMMKEIDSEYRSLIDELDAEGKNPLKSKVFDLYAAKVSSAPLENTFVKAEGQERTSVFDEPVNISEISYKERFLPITGKELKKAVSTAESSFYVQAKEKWGRDFFQSLVNRGIENPLDYCIERLIDGKEDVLTKYVHKDKTLVQMMADKEPNMVQKMDRRIDAMVATLSVIKPGSCIALEDGFNGTVCSSAVVTSVIVPKEDHIMYAGHYAFNVLIPGRATANRLTLSTLLDDPHFKVLSSDFDPSVISEFNKPRVSEKEVVRPVLDGNLFRAAEMSLQAGIGTQALYSDATGMMNRAVMLPQGTDAKEFSMLPMRVTDLDAVVEFIDTMHTCTLASNLSSTGGMGGHDLTLKTALKHGASIEKTKDDELLVSLPGSRQWTDWLRSHPEVMKITGPFGGSRDRLFAVVGAEQAGALMGQLYDAGLTMYAHSILPAQINDKDFVNPMKWFAERLGLEQRKVSESSNELDLARSRNSIDPLAHLDGHSRMRWAA